MHVTAFCSQKGGSGKTTLSGHLAVQAELAGFGPVALIDCDPQGSLAAWWNSRANKAPAFVRTSLDRLGADLDRLRENGFRHVVIDTPPAISQPILRVMLKSDLVVVPTRPSPHDLRAVRGTLDLIERAEATAVFVLNGAPVRGQITSEAAVALSQYGTVAPTFIHNRTLMASSMTDGRTVMEVRPECRSAQEISALWSYLVERYGRLRNRQVFQDAHRPVPRGFGRRGTDGDAPPTDNRIQELVGEVA